MKRFALALAAVAFLAGCSTSDSASANAKPYPLNVCIVSDEKLDSMGGPVVKVVNGQTVKFCCKDCVKDFDKEPAKYLTKLAGK